MVRQVLISLAIVASTSIPASTAWSDEEGDTLVAANTTDGTSGRSKGYRVRRITREGRYRAGFTIQLGAGVGWQIQNTENVESFSSVAVGGINFGIGGFVDRAIALLFRVAGSVAFPPPETFASVSTAGVLGTAAQIWPADWLKLEVGVGLAYQRVRRRELEDVDYGNFGVGIISSVAIRFWQRGNHTLQAGVTYTPLFVPGAPVHAMSLNLIYQFL